jgi:hypothetical protein
MSDQLKTEPNTNESQGWLTTKRRILIAVSVLAVVAIALMIVNELVKSKSTDTVSVAGEFDSVEISSPGKVTLTEGPVSISRSSEYVFKKPGGSSEIEDGVLELESHCGSLRLGVCTVDYNIALPADVAVTVDNGSGEVVVRGSKSDLDIKTKSGAVTLENSYGRVEAVTGSGSVKGTSVSSLEVIVESGSGEVDLQFAAAPRVVDVETESGAAKVRVPKSATNYKVDASSQTGRTVTDVTRDESSPFDIKVRSDSGDVTVESK